MNLKFEQEAKERFLHMMNFCRRCNQNGIPKYRKIHKASLRLIHMIDDLTVDIISLDRSGFHAIQRNHYMQIMEYGENKELHIKFVNFDNKEFNTIIPFTKENEEAIIQNYFKITYLAYI